METIEPLVREFEEAFNRGDLDKLMAMHCADATLAPNGFAGDQIKGKDNIRQFWKKGYDDGLAPLKLTITGVDKKSNGVLIENSVFKHSKGEGKYVVFWKLDNSNWFVWRSVFNV